MVPKRNGNGTVSHGQALPPLFVHVGAPRLLQRKSACHCASNVVGRRIEHSQDERIPLVTLLQSAEHDLCGTDFEETELLGQLTAAGAGLGRLQWQIEPFRFTAGFSDGERIVAVRYASDDCAPSLFWSRQSDCILVASEPLDAERDRWNSVPQCRVLLVENGDARLEKLG